MEPRTAVTEGERDGKFGWPDGRRTFIVLMKDSSVPSAKHMRNSVKRCEYVSCRQGHGSRCVSVTRSTVSETRLVAAREPESQAHVVGVGAGAWLLAAPGSIPFTLPSSVVSSVAVSASSPPLSTSGAASADDADDADDASLPILCHTI